MSFNNDVHQRVYEYDVDAAARQVLYIRELRRKERMINIKYGVIFLLVIIGGIISKFSG